jgi:glycosyltransferase involved in cell wall biosynthesis
VDDTQPYRYAVITTRNRSSELARAVAALTGQVQQVIVVDNNDMGSPHRVTPNPAADSPPDRVIWSSINVVLWDPEQPPNLSRLWNLGIDWAREHAARVGEDRWDVAVLNDDAIVPPGWFDQLAVPMRNWGCAAASAGLSDGTPGSRIHRTPGTTSLHQRMQGFAFILKGEAGLRADERLRWWCGDNDLDMQARAAGGTLVAATPVIEHLHPDQSTTGVLAEQTGIDMATFVDKWGFRPW